MRALFLLGAEKTKNEVGCYACYFPSICEIWNDNYDLVLTAISRSLKYGHAIIKWKLKVKFDKKIVKYFCITFLKAVDDHRFKSLAFLRC